ncbi:LysR substrate-binding domain-containing protein [Ancylobacter dichloromethanicus]|uniref:LysR substrate-binding domain-containing protein n=1 Tax=Ancylobacter dichloromethanicus TaxID=518825 RepID=UPI00361ED2B4
MIWASGFQRTKRMVRLTAAGAIFLDEARRVVAQAERAEEAARRAGRGELGHIEIGYVASTAFADVLQTQIRTYRAACPDVQVNCREIVMERLPAMLDEGQIDIAFLRPPIGYPPRNPVGDAPARPFRCRPPRGTCAGVA